MTTKYLAGALALAASLVTTTACAVSLNPKGLGQVLIYPYYTVNKNQDTLISVANASDSGTIIWVYVDEGYNGRDVLSFWLFLSPHDVWTASISQTSDDGGAVLRTADKSCTYPSIPEGGVLLSSANYDGTGPLPADSGPQSITRTREGFIQLIAGGDIIPGSPTDLAITHVQDGNPGGGAPPGCAELTAYNFGEDGTVPSNALYGSAAIVNVGQGTYFAYNADAIADFTDIPMASFSSGSFVDLSYANSAEVTRFDFGARAYLFGKDGRPLALDYQLGQDAVSAIFMSDAIYNEWLVDPSLGANTDWIVTFPTKEFYTDELYGSGIPAPPFPEPFEEGQANVEVNIAVHDREEGSPDVAQPARMLPYTVNAISFLNNAPAAGVPSGVFGSTLTNINIPPYGSAGAMTLGFATGDGNSHRLPGGFDLDGNEVTLIGLPAVGFMAYNIINTQAQPGMLANYGGAFPHRGTFSCESSDDACAPINTGAAPRQAR